MKIRIFRIVGLILISLSHFSCFGQDVPFTVEHKGLFHKRVIKRCGFELSHQQILEFMAADPLMENYARPMTGLFLTNTLLDATGSVLSSWPLLQLQFHKEPNLNLTYVGIGIMVSSLILNRVFMNKAVNAVHYYNNGYQEPKPEARVILKPASNGIGLALAF